MRIVFAGQSVLGQPTINMKFLVSLALAVAVAHADVSHVVGGEQAAETLKSALDISENQFSYGYETSNHIAAQASGQIVNPNSDAPAQHVQGQYSYVAPDGQKVEVVYVADENGYQPQGNVLPTPPPTPVAILRALEYIAAHPQKENEYVRAGPQPVTSVFNTAARVVATPARVVATPARVVATPARAAASPARATAPAFRFSPDRFGTLRRK